MGKRHKWADVIVAWSEGAEIEWKYPEEDENEWVIVKGMPYWNDDKDFRIKPQPKEPQYLYAFIGINGIGLATEWNINSKCALLGKIKLDQDDE